MLTERSIINFLIWTGGLILGPYLAVSAVEYNFYPAGVFAACCLTAAIFGFLRDKMCLLPLVGSFFAGHFNFIPVLRPAPVELFPLALIAYYLIAYVAIKRQKVLTGSLYFFIPALVIGLIILYHEHTFGLRSMGMGREGGRGALFLLVGIVSYVCGVSVNSPSPRALARVPIFCVVAIGLSSIPYTVTTYFPGTAPLFFIFTDNINSTAYSQSLDLGEGIVRNQGQSNTAAVLMTVLLSYYPIYSWWRPQRWWVALLSLGCIVLVIMGGFRSAFAMFGLTIFVAACCYSTWRALFLVPAVVLGVFLVTSLQDSQLVSLPKAAQRSLDFLPGNWDPDVVSTTTSSNDFRQKVEKVYLAEEARKSPFFGNGLSYDSAEFARYNYLALTHEVADGYYETKIFVTGKMFHSGWMSLYDAVGLVGFAAFLVFALRLLWVSGRMVFEKEADRTSPLFPVKVWMFCNIVPLFVGYFTVFGDFKGAFPELCFYAILWTHLDRIERVGYRSRVPVREVPFDPSRTAASLTA